MNVSWFWPPTFHILITSIGRPSLKRLLDSLQQLGSRDAITIVFDGCPSNIEPEWLLGHKATITIVAQNPNLGFWGHEIRNQYQGKLSPECTFVMHADDDDEYISGSFVKLRRLCKDPDTLYISKMKSGADIIPRQNSVIKLADIGTPNGIIPTLVARCGYWGHFYGGDFYYYNSVQRYCPVVFLDAIVYQVHRL
jgi:hypothetical protein